MKLLFEFKLLLPGSILKKLRIFKGGTEAQGFLR